MSILYKPVPIETIEQAKALPVGTFATRYVNDGLSPRREMSVREDREDSAIKWWHGFGGYTSHEPMIGWTALVPIEAGEETSKTFPDGQPYYTHTRVGGGPRRYIVRDDEGNQLADVTDEVNAWEATRKTRTRLVTPWEEDE